jgi:GTP cyclohydrolase I
MDLSSPATARAPRRFIKALIDATEGYEGDPNLITAFPTECRGGPDCHISQVIEGPVPFYSLCEHHSFPFFGHAFVGYIAHEHIIGISKLTRMVRLFSRRFTVQERLGQEIADLLVRELQPHGVAVYLVATHLCTQMRGVRYERCLRTSPASHP